MSQRSNWGDIKAARADSPARRRGYEKAGRAIRVAVENRIRRVSKGVPRT